MQARKSGFSAERVLFYWSKMYSDNFEAGSRYEELEQSFSVNVLGFNYLECEEYHSVYSIREDTRHDKLTDRLAIHIFELPKVPDDTTGDSKQQWMELIKADSEEALEMVKTNSKNPAIKKGIDAVYALNADTILREQIRQRDKAIRDYENDMATAIALGEERGMIKGLAEGEKKGKEIAFSVIAETMRNNGFTEEQIRLALGGMTTS